MVYVLQVDEQDVYYMKLALEEAEAAFKEGEVPVGAVVVMDGSVVSRAHNTRESSLDPTAHAELMALKAAPSDSWRRQGMTLYVTKEPCVMCSGAMINARLTRLVYGCRDAKGGAVDSLFRLLGDARLNHQVEVVSGVLEEECAGILKRFFQGRRGG